MLSPYIGKNSLYFLRVGLNLCLYFAGNVATCGASNQMRGKTCVDLVDFSPPDLDQWHMTNSQPSISLVKSLEENLEFFVILLHARLNRPWIEAS